MGRQGEGKRRRERWIAGAERPNRQTGKTGGERRRKSRRTDGGKGKEGRTKAGRKPDGERRRKNQAERNRRKGRLPERIENGGRQRWKGEVDRGRVCRQSAERTVGAEGGKVKVGRRKWRERRRGGWTEAKIKKRADRNDEENRQRGGEEKR